MITTYHATTKPHCVMAIFYDGLDHQRVLDWIKERGSKGVYEASSNEILVQISDRNTLHLKPGMVLIREYGTFEIMTEILFRSMYNIESESHF